MLKILLAGTVFVTLGPLGALAQQPPPDLPARDNPANGGAGIRTGNITSTGATVPNPGVSQGAGTTAMDRGIQQEDTKIQSSICKGC
jgi:hypothetical protein